MYYLYYYPGNASLAPHMLLQALGVEYELVLVDRDNQAQKSSEYLKLNPAGRIPTLVVDGKKSKETEGGKKAVSKPLVIFESAAICLYLLEQHPSSTLMPSMADTSARSRFYQWFMYITNTVQSELMLYFYPQKYTTNVNGAQGIEEMAEVRVTSMLKLLDQQLAQYDYIAGEISIADYFLFMVANWAANFKQPPLSFPHLSVYMKKMAQRIEVQAVFAKEGRELTRYLT
jgi:glutathione S-transferase